jgi:hypothetical protein
MEVKMEAHVEFTYGDLRIDKLAKEFYQTIVEKASICIRAIAGCRKKEVSFHRLIKLDSPENRCRTIYHLMLNS